MVCGPAQTEATSFCTTEKEEVEQEKFSVLHKPNRHSHSFISLPPNIGQVSRSTVQAYKFIHIHTRSGKKLWELLETVKQLLFISASPVGHFSHLLSWLSHNIFTQDLCNFVPEGQALVMLSEPSSFTTTTTTTTTSVAGAQGGQTLCSGVCTEGGYKYHRISLLAWVDGNVL